MAEPFDIDPPRSFGAGADRAKDDLNARFRDLRREAGAGAHPGSPTGEAFGAGTIRDQASQAADDAKSAAATVADQVRIRLNDIVAQQKSAGADKIAGVAKAAHSAASDLDGTSPQMAHLVRTAADSVDRIAEDVRARDLGQVFGTLAHFGRRQPVAFFGGAVVAGFLLARFFKSDAPLVDGSAFDAARRS